MSLYAAEHTLLCEYVELIRKEMKEREPGQDEDEAKNIAINDIVIAMTRAECDKLFMEYGVHDAYQSYWNTYHEFPEHENTVIYHILYESVTSE